MSRIVGVNGVSLYIFEVDSKIILELMYPMYSYLSFNYLSYMVIFLCFSDQRCIFKANEECHENVGLWQEISH